MARTSATSVVAVCLLSGVSLSAHGGAMEQARRIHDRLAGVPPTDQVLLDMTDNINGVGVDFQGIPGTSELAAAYRAMDNPGFYNVTLKNWAAPWTNRDQSVFVPLNDYTATIIGMVRDDVPFNTVLSANLVYVGSGGGLPAYSMTDNNHYEAMESQGTDLQASLVGVPQTQVTDIPLAGVAGIVTTRAAAEAFFVAGTNRAMFRFTMMNHLCNDMEPLKDITRVPDRIRQDVSRSPGGDSRIFLNNCIGCHNGMDPLTGAYAYYDFDETLQRIMYTPGQVQPKYFNNDANFPQGFVTTDDSWLNYWRAGPNELLGWGSGPASGNGAASMGAELANSQVFAQCQMKKVFKAICLREPGDQPDRDRVDLMVSSFTGGGSYNMKRAFAEAAVYCKGP